MKWKFETEEKDYSFIIEADDNENAFDVAYDSYGPQVHDMMYQQIKSYTVTEYSSGDFGDLGNKIGTIEAVSKEDARIHWQKLKNIPDSEIRYYDFQ